MTPRPKLILITDPRYAIAAAASAIARARAALAPGELLVQLRDKSATSEELARAARALAAAGAPIVLNGAPEEAARLGLAGVHLGGRAEGAARARAILGADAFISVAAHDEDDVARALDAGASAALVSPIFASPGKAPPRGEAALVRARALAGHALAIYALGGVEPRLAASCAAAGADGVAVIRAIFEAENPAEAATALVAPFRRAGC